MRSLEPPLMAKWLLKHFGCSPMNEAILGDLAEQYSSGRSSRWYWHQAVKAIIAGFVKEIRSNKLATVHAMGTGWIVLSLCYFFVFRPTLDLLTELFPQSPLTHHLFSNVLPSAWAIYYKALYPSFVFIVIGLLGCLLTGWSGWIVARMNRSHRKPMVLVHALSVFICHFAYASVFPSALYLDGSPYIFAYVLLSGVAMNRLAGVIATSCILLGGGLFTTPKSSHQTTHLN